MYYTICRKNNENPFERGSTTASGLDWLNLNDRNKWQVLRIIYFNLKTIFVAIDPLKIESEKLF